MLFLYTFNSHFSAWSEEGCEIRKTNETHTVCECNHLTNFAVLMDVHAVRLDIAHQVALQIITYIGCIISVVCLVLAILTFQLFRGLKVITPCRILHRSRSTKALAASIEHLPSVSCHFVTVG